MNSVRALVAVFVLCSVIAGAELAAQSPGWTQATAAAPWVGRNGHAAVVFNNRIWVLGGWQTAAPTYMNDVWSSADGVNWVQETAMAQWPGRAQFTAAAFDNKIWIMGGWDGTRRQDVWYSSDGVTWTQAPLPSWTGRNGHYTMVHDNKLWVVAGLDASIGRRNDVYSTTDGLSWQLVNASAQFPGQSHGAGVAFDNKLWICGGLNTNNQVWSSPDGVTWTAATLAAQWPARYAHAMQAFNGRLWVMGGLAPSVSNDVWASPDGVTWTQQPMPPWGARQYHATVVFDGRMWVLGGVDGGSNRFNDVWVYSETMPPQITSVAPTSARAGDLYTYDVVATGIPAPVISASGLPSWLSLVGDQLTGTPTPADLGQTGMITVTATNSVGFYDQNFQIDVAGIPPQITSSPPGTVIVGQNYGYAVTSTGVPASTYSVGALPAWLSFNTATGEFSGVPAVGDIGLSAQIQVTAANGWPPNAVQSFQIDVRGVPPTITSTPPALSVQVGETWSYTIVATGEPAPGFSVMGNPSWLTLTGNVLSGVPTAADIGLTGNITVIADNSWPPNSLQNFQIQVIGLPPQITSQPILEAVPGTTYSYTLTVTGAPAPTLSVTSTLPGWLSFDAGTRTLSGTPGNDDQRTSVDVTIEATNGVPPTAMQTFTIEVKRKPGASVGSSDSGGCAANGWGGLWLIVGLVFSAWIRARRHARTDA